MSYYIAYYRVSTKKQGRSGLGLDAQRFDVEKYVHDKGKILAEYIEVESGRKNNRIELLKAIQKAKESGAMLVVAKLDRLSRDASFTIQLSNSDVNFVCVDNPNVNKMTIGILALMNQEEAERISIRTKAALQEKKKKIALGIITNSRIDPSTGEPTKMKPDKKGVYRLGNPLGYTEEIIKRGHQANRELALQNENSKRAKSVIRDTLLERSDASLSFLAKRLNTYGLRTSRGKMFNKFNVAYLKRMVVISK